MVMKSLYLDSLEREHEPVRTWIIMTREDYENQIKVLNETIRNLYGVIDTLKLTADSLRTSNDKTTAQNSSLKALIKELQRELKKYQDYNGLHNKMSMGKKSLKHNRVRKIPRNPSLKNPRITTTTMALKVRLLRIRHLLIMLPGTQKNSLNKVRPNEPHFLMFSSKVVVCVVFMDWQIW